MSLKSKLEAVIYASEEPVTLAQLAALFAVEALEWKAEQEQAAAQEAQTAAELADQPAETLEIPLEGAITVDAEVGASGESAAESAPDQPSDPEADARRAARQREREVKAILRTILEELIADYGNNDRGLEIREIAGGYRMATKPEYHDAVRLFIKSLKPPMKLSLPALETLAVIAYKQPVTAPEVNEIRGVESAGVLGSLLSRKLIATAGRKQVIGRPILYKTTKEFLLRFGLKDLSELPSMEEFEKIAALELNEPDPVADAESEPVNAEDIGPATGPDLDEDAPEEPADAQVEQAAESAQDAVTAEPESGKAS